MTDTTGFSVMATLKRAAPSAQNTILKPPHMEPNQCWLNIYTVVSHFIVCRATYRRKYKAVNSPLLTDQVIEVAQLGRCQNSGKRGRTQESCQDGKACTANIKMEGNGWIFWRGVWNSTITRHRSLFS